MNHAEDIWKTLLRATVDKKHPWRVVSFSTSGPNGPAARSVILRGVLAAERRLVFYTDRRSAKMTDLAHCPNVALLFWNPKANTQLRVCGNAFAESSELIVNDLWLRIPDHARKDYATLSAPGHALDSSQSGHDLRAARSNFVVLNVQVEEMEWLSLSREGHQRTLFTLDEAGQWQPQALVP